MLGAVTGLVDGQGAAHQRLRLRLRQAMGGFQQLRQVVENRTHGEIVFELFEGLLHFGKRHVERSQLIRIVSGVGPLVHNK